MLYACNLFAGDIIKSWTPRCSTRVRRNRA